MPAFSRTRRLLVLLLALAVLTALAVPALAAGPAGPAGSGTPAGTAVTGAVLDSDGNPVAGATVELLRQDAGLVDGAVTGSDGSYRLTTGNNLGLDFRLRVWAEGFGTAEQTWVPMVDRGRVDFALNRLSAALAGRVVDGNADPVPEALVQVFRKGAGLVAGAVTGSDGSYRIADLRAGSGLSVQVVLAGYSAFQQALPALAVGATLRLDPVVSPLTATLSGQVVDGYSGAGIAGARLEVLRQGRGLVVEETTDDGGNFAVSLPGTAAADYQVRVFANGYSAHASALFALPGGSVKDLAGSDQIVLTPPTGTVVGFVVDTGGAARSGVAVHLDRLGLGTVATTSTDSAGWYAFGDVPATADQAYRVRVLPATADNAAVVDSAWFALAGGAQYEADINVPFLAAVTGSYGTLSGRVVDDTGRPVTGVTVIARRALGAAGSNVTATTDQYGHYRLDLPASRPNAFSYPPGYVVSVSADGFISNDQPTVVLPPATTATSAAVTPPPASLVDVYANKITTANFALKASTGRISGRALDPQGRPVPGAAVTLLREGKGTIATATTDVNGRYSFRGFAVVGRASYLTEVRAEGYLPSVLSKDGGSGNWLADAAGGLGTVQDVRLQRTDAALTGAVVDGGGRAVTGARVTATELLSGKTYTATTGPDGIYHLESLPATGQSYALSATKSRHAPSSLAKAGDLAPALTPNPGDRLAADLLLVPEFGSLSGIVYGDDGGAVAHATVELWQEGAGVVTTVTADPAGRYSFDALVPGGRYGVRARVAGYRLSSLKYGIEYVPGLISVEGGDQAIWNIVLYR